MHINIPRSFNLIKNFSVTELFNNYFVIHYVYSIVPNGGCHAVISLEFILFTYIVSRFSEIGVVYALHIMLMEHIILLLVHVKLLFCSTIVELFLLDWYIINNPSEKNYIVTFTITFCSSIEKDPSFLNTYYGKLKSKNTRKLKKI